MNWEDIPIPIGIPWLETLIGSHGLKTFFVVCYFAYVRVYFLEKLKEVKYPYVFHVCEI
jgi:hypothetical protein